MDATLTNGVGNFTVIVRTAGVATITATDTVTASITGTSAAVTVTDPNALPEPEATVDQSSVEAGETLLVEGSGFLPGEQVQIWLHSDPVLLATVVADSAGTISHLAMVPADTPAGTHSFAPNQHPSAPRPAATRTRQPAEPSARCRGSGCERRLRPHPGHPRP